MATPETNEPAAPSAETSAAAEPTPVDPLQRLRQKQIIVLASCIAADVLLFGVGCWLLYKYGIDLNAAKLFQTAMIFLTLCGAVPAVALAIFWPHGGEHEQAAIRRTQYGYNVIMACRLLFGVLVILNVIIGRYGPRHFDWTSDKVFTLDSVSVKQVQALDKPVKFLTLYPRLSEPGRQLETLFLMYEDASKMVSHEFVDRFADKVRTDEVYKDYPDAKQTEPVVIVTYGAGDNPEHKTIRHTEIFVEPPPFVRADTRELKTEFKGEDAFTSAITQLTQAKKTNVYFTTGHGELALDNSDRRSDEGAGLLKERMEAQGIKVESINLVQKEIPKDASILVVAGPQTSLFPEELQKVKDFLAGGGRLIAMLESGPEMQEEATTGLEGLLADHNVQTKDNLAIDRMANVGSPVVLLLPVAESRSNHSIVEDLKEYQVLMDRAREVAPAIPASPPGQPPGASTGPYKAETLITTVSGNTLTGQPISWGETEYKVARGVAFNESDDTRGPVSLAVAVSKSEGPDPHMGMPGAPPPRDKATPLMVVFGDASFAANYWISQVPTNRDLFLNSVNWLRGRLELIGIQPHTKKSLRLTVTSGEFWRMILMPLGVMMICLIGTAGLVWIVRHRF